MRVFYCVAIYVMWDILYSFQDAALWSMTAAIHPASAQFKLGPAVGLALSLIPLLLLKYPDSLKR